MVARSIVSVPLSILILRGKTVYEKRELDFHSSFTIPPSLSILILQIVHKQVHLLFIMANKKLCNKTCMCDCTSLSVKPWCSA